MIIQQIFEAPIAATDDPNSPMIYGHEKANPMDLKGRIQQARRCKIYESRPEGCRTYPEVRHIQRDIWHFPGCGYYLEEEKK